MVLYRGMMVPLIDISREWFSLLLTCQFPGNTEIPIISCLHPNGQWAIVNMMIAHEIYGLALSFSFPLLHFRGALFQTNRQTRNSSQSRVGDRNFLIESDDLLNSTIFDTLTWIWTFMIFPPQPSFWGHVWCRWGVIYWYLILLYAKPCSAPCLPRCWVGVSFHLGQVHRCLLFVGTPGDDLFAHLQEMVFFINLMVFCHGNNKEKRWKTGKT